MNAAAGKDPGRRVRAETSIIAVTGVAGSGKSTVGALLAGWLRWDYAEADDFHPPANLAKMRAGRPLTDEDRLPWLRAIAAWMDQRIAAGRPAVVTCSALKRAYRDLLRQGRPQLRLVYLDGDPELIAQRMTARQGHFFPAELLQSQLRDLQPPQGDEHPVTVSIAGTPIDIVQEIVERLELRPAPAEDR